jgi:hypothetical protein
MVTARNDITGDSLTSRQLSEEGKTNYDIIFPEKRERLKNNKGDVVEKCSKRCWLLINENDEFNCHKPNCKGIPDETNQRSLLTN